MNNFWISINKYIGGNYFSSLESATKHGFKNIRCPKCYAKIKIGSNKERCKCDVLRIRRLRTYSYTEFQLEIIFVINEYALKYGFSDDEVATGILKNNNLLYYSESIDAIDTSSVKALLTDLETIEIMI